MLFNDFVRETREWWTTYLKRISVYQHNGMLDSGDGRILYPNMLMVTEISGFRLAELIGAQQSFSSLRILRHRQKSIYRYLSQFDDSVPAPLCVINGGKACMSHLCLARGPDLEFMIRRFPFIELFLTRLLRDGQGSLLDFSQDFLSCTLENSVLVNRQEALIRCKNILTLIITSSRISKRELLELFESSTNGKLVKGVHTIGNDGDERLLVAGHLQSLYLQPEPHETTIGAFINSHPEVVKKVFKTSNFVYEPLLEWVEHDGTVPNQAINPDLMIRRDDGYYDIYDLKRAALERKRITKGEQRRRRFIDYVNEGIAQLAHYDKYFQFAGNREYAARRYGIQVSKPNLVLVVGNWDNVNKTEISEASRAYRSVTIIDYDTLVHLFLGVADDGLASVTPQPLQLQAK